MNELTETQKAYLAGFFDGEGCVSITRYAYKKDSAHRTPVYQLHVVVAQKDEMLYDLCEMCGVGVVHKHSTGKYSGHQWHISPKESLAFLTAILPYLRNKKREAEIAIEYQSKQGHKNGSTGRGWTVPQELIDEKEAYYRKLQELKGTSGINGGRGRPKIRHEGES